MESLWRWCWWWLNSGWFKLENINNYYETYANPILVVELFVIIM
jgi:hypothetical protein